MQHRWCSHHGLWVLGGGCRTCVSSRFRSVWVAAQGRLVSHHRLCAGRLWEAVAGCMRCTAGWRVSGLLGRTYVGVAIGCHSSAGGCWGGGCRTHVLQSGLDAAWVAAQDRL